LLERILPFLAFFTGGVNFGITVVNPRKRPDRA